MRSHLRRLGLESLEDRVLLSGIDFGDFYYDGPRQVPLLRSDDQLIVGLAPGADPSVAARLAAPGGPLDGFAAEAAALGNVWIFSRPGAGPDAGPDSDARYNQLVELIPGVVATEGVAYATPGLLLAENGAAMHVTRELFIALEAGIDPDDVFAGPEFAAYRPLRGTTGQYIVTTTTDPGHATLALGNQLQTTDPRVAWATPDFYVTMQRTSLNDPLLGDQWHLNNTGQGGGGTLPGADAKVFGAWDQGVSGSGVIVAVLDDSVQWDHPDLIANAWSNPGEIAGNGIDDDGNGWIDDVRGWDFADGDNDPRPALGTDNHGTAVAGVTLARGNNSLGVAGAGYGATLMSVRLPLGRSAPISVYVESIYYVSGRTADGLGTWRGADIGNHSYGGGGSIPGWEAAFDWSAANGRGGLGTVNFVATGNDGTGAISFPARYASNIAVGASTDGDVRSGYSQFGPEIDFLAPSNGGVRGITTTDRTGGAGYGGGDYTGSFGGTSSATPLAAGVGALVLEAAPALTFAEVRQLLRDTADKINSGNVLYDANGFNIRYGYGRINATLAVLAARDVTPVVTVVAPVGTTRGVPLTDIQVATFTEDSGLTSPSNFTATIDWGDGTVIAGTVVHLAGDNFEVRGSHTYALAGLFPLKVTVVNTAGNSDTDEVDVLVVGTDLSITPIPITVSQGVSFTERIGSFVDASAGVHQAGDYLAFVDWGDGTPQTAAAVAEEAGGFFIDASHTYLATGNFQARVSLVNTATGDGVADFVPVLVEKGPFTVLFEAFTAIEGQLYDGVVAQFIDSNPLGQASDFTAQIDWGDGTTSGGTIVALGDSRFEVRGTHTYAAYGSRLVTVEVFDLLAARTETDQGVIDVGDAPIISDSTRFVPREGIPFNTVIGSFFDTNPNGTIGEFSVTVDWGDGTVEPGQFYRAGIQYFIVGGHTYGNEGSYEIRIDVASVGGSTSTSTQTVIVANGRLEPFPRSFTQAEGTPFTVVVAAFQDENPSSTAAEFGATIDWGDGTVTAGSVVKSGVLLEVHGTHTYAAGNYQVRVTLTELDTVGTGAVNQAVALGGATVLDAPIDAAPIAITAAEGVEFVGAVATITDANPLGLAAQFTATIHWGDGTSTAGTISGPVGGPFEVLGAHTYAPGTYQLIVNVVSVGGRTDSTQYQLVVANGTLVASAAGISPREGRAFSGVVATFTDTNPSGQPGDYTATIRWGDGTITTGATVTRVGLTGAGLGLFEISGAHTYRAGTYTLVATIADGDGASAEASATFTVADEPITAVGSPIDSTTEGTPLANVEVATFVDANPSALASDYTSTIAWGDGTTSSGTVTLVSSSPDQVLFRITGSHAYNTIADFEVVVTIFDARGTAVATGTTSVAVENADLSPGAERSLAGLLEKNPFTAVVATFTDGNPLAAAEDFTATIDWGDGSAPTAGFVSRLADGTFEVRGAHAYAIGTFPISTTITDDGGSAITLAATATVANAPTTAAAVPIGATEGTPFTGVVATFVDGNPLAQAGDYAITILSGNLYLPGVAVSRGNGRFDVVPAPGSDLVFPAAGTTTIQVSISDQFPGSPATAVANSPVTIANATLTPTGTIVVGVEDTPQSFVLGSFRDANPSSNPADFVGTIDWGDGTTSEALIESAGGGVYRVSATHAFADPGTYRITVGIVDTGSSGGGVVIASGAWVANQTYALTASLAATSDSGVSNSDGITNVTRPVLRGQAGPFSTVMLVAKLAGQGDGVFLGMTSADAQGTWALPSGATLGEGAWSIEGVAVDGRGYVTSAPTVLMGGPGQNALVIDTTGPRVTSAVFDPRLAQFAITFADAGSGVAPATAFNPGNYGLTQTVGFSNRTIALSGLTALAGTPGGPLGLIAHFGGSRPLARGSYVLRINSAGVTDLAGNILDERTLTPFPSISRAPGQPYVAEFLTNGASVQGPRPFVPPSEMQAAQRYRDRLFLLSRG